MLRFLPLFLSLLIPGAFARAETHYDVLSVGPQATPAEIEFYHRVLLNFYDPATMTDPESKIRLWKVRVAYATLSDPWRRLEYDISRGVRVRGGIPITATFEKRPTLRSPRNPDHLPEFFTTDGAAGLPFTGIFDGRLIYKGELNAKLDALALDDALDKTERYQLWQKALRHVVDQQTSLVNIGLTTRSQTAAGRSVGRRGDVLTWGLLGWSGLAALGGPAPERPLAAAAFLATPLIAHVVSYWFARGDLTRALRALGAIKSNILRAVGAGSLINALAAYDFIAATFARSAHDDRRPNRFERLQRTWLLKVTEKDPLVMKGWLIRALQADDTDLKGKFWRDLRGRPNLWRRVVRELVDEAPAATSLHARAAALAAELDRQSPGRTVAYNVEHKIGWVCELILANVDAAVRRRPGPPRE